MSTSHAGLLISELHLHVTTESQTKVTGKNRNKLKHYLTAVLTGEYYQNECPGKLMYTQEESQNNSKIMH